MIARTAFATSLSTRAMRLHDRLLSLPQTQQDALRVRICREIPAFENTAFADMTAGMVDRLEGILKEGNTSR